MIVAASNNQIEIVKNQGWNDSHPKQDFLQDLSNDEDNETTNDVKVHITVEKRSPVSDSDSQVQILLVYSNDKKVESDKLSSYNCQTIQTRNNFFKVTIHFKEKKPFVIIVQRTDKKDFAEEVFVSFTCKNNFDLYDVDFPDQLFEEIYQYPFLLQFCQAIDNILYTISHNN